MASLLIFAGKRQGGTTGDWLGRSMHVKDGPLAGMTGVVVRCVDPRRLLVEPDGFESGVYLVVAADALEMADEMGSPAGGDDRR